MRSLTLRKIRSLGRRWPGAAVLLGALPLACSEPATDGGPDTEVAAAQQALDRANLPVVSGNPLAGKPLNETVTMAAVNNDPDTACEQCSFSRADDLSWSNPSVTLNSLMLPALFGQYTPPALQPNAGLPDAYDEVTGAGKCAYDRLQNGGAADNINDVLETVEDFLEPFGTVTRTNASKSVWIHRFPSVHARHLVSGPQGSYPAQPKLFSEITDRAARMYCANREAALAAALQPWGPKLGMLEGTATDVLLWKAGVTDAALTYLPTSQSACADTSPDGAQVFAIPMAIGARTAPLAGPLIPDFGEIEHPIVWVTGDGEVKSLESGGSEQWRNLAHMDVVAGVSSTGGKVEAEVTLIDLGFFELQMNIGASAEAGVLEPGWDDGKGKVLWNVFHEFGAPIAWPVPRESTNHRDMPIGPGLGCMRGEFPEMKPFEDILNSGNVSLQNDCLLHAFGGTYANPGGQFFEAQPGWGTAARWWMDDDRSVTLRDQVSFELGVTGVGKISFGILSVGATAHMQLGIASRVHTTVRNHVSLVQGAEGEYLQSNLVVNPVGDTVIEKLVPLEVGLDLELMTPIGPISWSPTILTTEGLVGNLPIELSKTLALEGDRLRVGDFSEQPSGTGLVTDSHLPGGQAFTPLPESVAECLSQDPPAGSEPDPKPTGQPGAPYGLCWYGPSAQWLEILAAHPMSPPLQFFPGFGPVPDDVCDDKRNIEDYVRSSFTTVDQRKAIHETLEYLCGYVNDTRNVSKVVDFDGEKVVAHLVQKGQVPDEASLSADMFAMGIDAFVHGTAPGWIYAEAQIYARYVIRPHVCDTETLLPVGLGPADPFDCPDPDPVFGVCPPLDPCFLDWQGFCQPVCTDTSKPCEPEPLEP